MNQRVFSLVAVVAVVVAGLVCTTAMAQPGGRGPGGRGFGFGGPGMFGGGGGVVGLLSIDAVQAEIELTDDQKQECDKLIEETRGQRPGRGEGGERPDFRNMSDEERQEFFARMQKEREERAKASREKLSDILLPHQMERLDEISVQLQGIAALQNPEVAAKLGLSEEKQTEIRETMQENMTSMREKMRELFQPGGDREGMREKMEELRKEMEDNVLAKLSDEEQKKFEELKGKPFEMPADAFRGRGGRGQGGRGQGGNRPNRQQRPDSI